MNPVDDQPVGRVVHRYALTFLTDQWEWDGQLTDATLEQAKTTARGALEAVVRDENPELACVYVLEGGRRVGVWDWIGQRPFWTPL